MIVREAQMEALRDSAIRDFQNRMVQHLELLFPAYSKTLQEAGLRKVIDFGIQEAARHGFRAESTVCRYIDLMFLLGSGFDVDRQFPWAAAILNRPGPEDELRRMEALYGRAQQYLNAVAGPENQHIRQALARLDASPPVLPAHAPESKLWEIYPEKTQEAGAAVLRELVEQAKQKARSYGFTSPEAADLFAGLMFALGSSFDSDPKLPWLDASLSQRAGASEEEAVRSLYDKAMAFVKSCLSEGQSRA